MNKQEVIKILEKKREAALDNSEYYRNKENEKYEKMNRARVDSYTLAIQLVEQIEEPQAEKVGARLAEHWHEDIGPVLWWNFPVEEPPYCGTPLDEHFPKYKTHFSMIDMPNEIEKPKRWVVTTTDSDTCYLKRFRMGKECLDGDISKVWVGELGWAFTFNDKSKAEAVATLVEGSVEEV